MKPSDRVRPRLALALLVAAALPGAAQQAPVRRNAFYAEGMGAGGLYSLNYERITPGQRTWRVGITAWSIGCFVPCEQDIRYSLVAVPLMVYQAEGDGPNKFEYGAGVLMGRRGERNVPDASGPFATGLASIGYLRRPANTRTEFRLAWTPFLGGLGGRKAFPSRSPMPWSAIGFGFRF